MTNSNWRKVKLDTITDNLDNKRIPVTREKRSKGNIPYYGATGVVDYVDDYIFDEKLLLVGEDGADWSAFANTAYIIDGKSWVNNHAHVLRATGADITFLKEYLNYADLRPHTTGTTRGKLNKSDLMSIQIPLPPINIQEKISLIFSLINNQIIKTDQIIQKTEVLKRGLMQELLTKGIGHKKFVKTKIGEIPEEWIVKKFEEFAVLQRGYDLPIQDRTKGEYELITSNGVTDTHNQFKVKGPGVVTGRSGTLGKVFYVEKDFWPLNTTLYVKDFHGNNEKFVYYKIQSFDISRFGTGTGVPTLNRNNVHKELVAVPEYLEQIKIAKIISTVDEKISINKKIKTRLILLKMGLMQDIFSQKVQIN